MTTLRKLFVLLVGAVVACLIFGCKVTNPNDTEPVDSATFEQEGESHITRVVPMPATVSPEAQEYLTGLTKKSAAAQTLEQRRAGTDQWRARQSAEAKRVFPVNVEETTTAGVRTHIITPLETPESNKKL